MRILGKRLYFGVFLFALCTVTSAESKKEAARAKRDALIAEAQKYIGSPYVNGATGPESFDCSGFIYFIARKSARVQLPRSSHAIYRFVEHIPDDEIETGDLLFFSASSSGRITHVGLYIGEDKMIHAASDGPKTGVIVSSRNERYWKTHYVGAGRFVPAVKSEADGKTSDTSGKQKIDSQTSNETSDKNANATAPSAKSDKKSGEKTAAGKSAEDAPSASVRKDTPKIDGASKMNNGDSRRSVDNFICSFSASVDWSLFEPDRFFANFRGINSAADITVSKRKLRPGIGTMVKGYNGGAVLVPLVFILEVNDNIRVYAGPAVTLGSPTFSGERTASSAFSGTFGISFCTPSHDAGIIGIRFMQDISYTVFKKSDGSIFSFTNAFCAGFAFTTGMRISLPVRAFAGRLSA